MSGAVRPRPIVRSLLGVGAVGAGCLAYAGLYEVNAFRLRRVDVPVLPPGARPIRVLHMSDVHMTPYARARQRWLSTLGALEPDLVINTGDNLAHEEAVPFVLGSFGRLLDRPGVYVWGVERLLRRRHSRIRCAISRVRAAAIVVRSGLCLGKILGEVSRRQGGST